MQQYQSLWEQILAEMHDHLDDEIYNEYFAPLSNVQKLNDSYLYVVAPSGCKTLTLPALNIKHLFLNGR